MDESPDNSTKRDWKQLHKSVFDRRKLSKRLRRAETVTTRHAHRFILKRLDNLRASRQHIIAWLLLVSAIITVIGVQLGVSARQYTTESPVAGGTYAEGVVGKLDTLNPLYATSSAEVAASRLLFSSLYDYDNTGTLRPDIAKSLSMSKDRKTYTLVLRDGVKWHDGAALTAQDVEFTINTIKNPDARVRSSLAANWQSVGVKAIDDHTIQFTLPPYAAFPHALTFPILPKHILSRIAPSALQESTFSQSPVGSGPFVYRLLQTADGSASHRALHLVVNENYYERAPMLTRFELHAYPDNAALVSAVKAHEVTAAVDVDADEATIAKSGYLTDRYSIDNGVYALMNTTRGVLSDKKVRESIRLAIDTEKLREVAGGKVEKLDLPFITSQVEGASAITSPPHSSDTANAILTKAGWSVVNGVRTKGKQQIAFTITVPKNDQYERVAHAIAKQLAAVMIRAKVVVIDTSLPRSSFIQDVLQARNYQMLVYELPIGADPDVFAYWHSSQRGANGYNFTNYKNGVADAALVSARDVARTDLRDAKYIAFAEQWLRDVPAIGLYQQTMAYTHNPNSSSIVEGTQLVSLSDRYSNIGFWTVNRARVYKTP